ncbi:ImmA/IrrE family metallo-endopeptidase [Streptomyces mirabilis]
MAHEMAHVVLEHSFSTLLRTSGGECRESDREQEAEAAELSGELLIPSDAALRLVTATLQTKLSPNTSASASNSPNGA